MTECGTVEKSVLREHLWRARHSDTYTPTVPWPVDCVPNVDTLEGFGTGRVYEWETESSYLRAFEVELSEYTGFKYVLDFSGSTNHEIESLLEVTDMVVTAKLQPFEKKIVCVLTCSKQKGGNLRWKVTGSQLEVLPSIVTKVLELNQKRIRAEFDSMKAALTGLSPDDSGALEAALSSGKLQFVDEDFYPSPTALYKDGSELVAEERIVWRRAADFCKKAAVFSGDIEPSDVVQGSLGDCWFCSSLAAMAERPQLIERLFVTKQYSEVGLYRVRFCQSGIWQEIVLDDFIPCRPFQEPIYTKTGGGELWAALLEKAYAKVCGCYERLDGGSPFDALPDLSGCPATNCDFRKFDDAQRRDLWDKLLEWKATEHNLMSASCSNESLMDASEAGLFQDHSYTVLDAKQWLKEEATSSVRLLCLRNPWGRNEWNKDWSDEDEKHWTNDAVHFFQPTLDATDGTFWMSYEDFLKYFTKLTVAHCRPDFVDARIPLHLDFDFDSKQLTVPLVRLKIPDGGHCEFLGIYQTDIRKKDAPEYLDLALFVFEDNATGSRRPVAFSKMDSEKHQFLRFGEDSEEFKKPLAAGNYLLMPYTSGVHWNPASGSTRPIALSAHMYGTSVQPTMEVVGTYTHEQITDALLECSLQLGDKNLVGKLQCSTLRAGNLRVSVGRNISDGGVITYTRTDTMENFVDVCGFPQLAEGCSFELRPDDCAIFGVQVIEDTKKGGSSQCQIGYKHVYKVLVNCGVQLNTSALRTCRKRKSHDSDRTEPLSKRSRTSKCLSSTF